MIFPWQPKLTVELQKNRRVHPKNIVMIVKNRSRKGVVIEPPVVRFKRIFGVKAFKINQVDSQSIYPMFIEAKSSHDLVISLLPFYEYLRKLKRFSRLRIEIKSGNKFYKSKYIYLKSTLWKTA